MLHSSTFPLTFISELAFPLLRVKALCRLMTFLGTQVIQSSVVIFHELQPQCLRYNVSMREQRKMAE